MALADVSVSISRAALAAGVLLACGGNASRSDAGPGSAGGGSSAGSNAGVAMAGGGSSAGSNAGVGMAGGGSSAGSNAGMAGGGVGMAGGGGSGGSGGVPEECQPRPLSEYCAAHPCPRSPAEVQIICSAGPPFGGSSRSPTLCGGTYVVVPGGIYATGYYFDAQGTLVGVVTGLSDTTTFPCPSGFTNNSYGSLCTIDTGAWINLCAGGGGGGGGGTGGKSGSAGAGGA